MNTTPTQGEIRPSVTTGDPFANPYAEPFTVPLLRLRGYDRPVIEPEDCRVPGCLVCQWRRAGLLDPPGPTGVVREGGPEAYCPGCNAYWCSCPPAGHEDALAEAAYALGYDHGHADGPENRPTRRWLIDAGLDPEPYLDGYDDACGSALWPAEGPVGTGVRPAA